MFLFVKKVREAGLRGPGPESAVFFCYKGGLRWPLRPLGVGGGVRDLISPLLSGEALPPPSWAGGPGALPEAQNGGRAATPRGPAPRLTGLRGLEKEKKARSLGTFTRCLD